MVYLFSSSPRTIVNYFEEKDIQFQLVTPNDFVSFKEAYKTKSGDLGLVYDFGKFIPESLLQAIPMLNIHFSLLPKYRGAIPVEAALLAGDKITGISVQKMVKAMDEGPLLYTRSVEINPELVAYELQGYMDSLLPEILEEVLEVPHTSWNFTEQVGEPSYCYEKELQRERGKIMFTELTSTEVVNRVRAYNPEPFAWCMVSKKEKNLEMNISRATRFDEQLAPGSFRFVKKQGLAIGCKEGTVLVTELTIAGSKKLVGGDIASLKGSIELQV